ncbi:hypothetical protein J6590_056434 [Homalodisca vitripennis]|nr:hypothetical protein J6590_056434 [Homalodisca vitripennis]
MPPVIHTTLAAQTSTHARTYATFTMSPRRAFYSLATCADDMEEGTSQSHPPAQGHGTGDVESIHIQDGGGLSDGSWLCCLPCSWLQRNTSVHKASLSVAMLLVMSLLVASPVLFLISSAPSANKNTPCKNQTPVNNSRTCKQELNRCQPTR